MNVLPDYSDYSREIESSATSNNNDTDFSDTFDDGESFGELRINELEGDEQNEAEEETEEKKDMNQEVIDYFRDRRVSDLFQFMCNHVIVNEPDDPVEFLKQLMDKCLIYRARRLADIPAVFEEPHVRALFDTFDRLAVGSIPISMYHKAMEVLKLDYYEMNPGTDEQGDVPKEIFVANAQKAQAKELLDIILLPPTKEIGFVYPFGKSS